MRFIAECLSSIDRGFFEEDPSNKICMVLGFLVGAGCIFLMAAISYLL